MKKHLFALMAVLLVVGFFWAQRIVSVDDVNNLPEVIPVNNMPQIYHPDTICSQPTQLPMQPSSRLFFTDNTNNMQPTDPTLSQFTQEIPIEGSGELPDIPGYMPVKPRFGITKAEMMGYKTFRTPPKRQNDYISGELCIEFWDIARGKLNIQTKNSYIATGIPEIDALNSRYKAVEMPRLVNDIELPPMALEYRLDLMFLIKMEKGLDMEAVAAEYKTMPMVKCAHPNYIPHAANITRTYPNDTYFDWAPNITQGPAAWTLSYGNNTDTLGIIDVEQFNNTHADLDNNYAGVYAGTSTLGTTSWHGTGCASHACAELNSSAGISGAAGGWSATKGVLWMPYRINSTADNVTAVSWMVTNGACIISQSALYLANPEILEDAYANALANNVLSFAAAGNDNNYYTNNMWPAYFNCVLGVGGIDNFGRHWAWDDSSGSNYGDWVDITAPGEAHWTCTATGYEGGYGGTSWATPRAAAIGAMIVNYRGVRGVQLLDIMRRTSDYVNHLSEDCYSFGAAPYVHNKVNAYEAIMFRDKNVSVNWIAASSDLNPYANCYYQYLNFDVRDSLYGRHSHGLVPYVAVKPRAMVQNRGKTTENFNVTATSTSYTSTKLVSGLEPGSAQIVVFDPFTPGTNSAYTMTVYTSLYGDQNTKNDTFAVNLACGYADTVQKDGGDFTVTYTDAWFAWAAYFMPERLCTLKTVQVWLSDSGTGTNVPACSVFIWDNIQGKPGTRLYSQRFTATDLADGKIWRSLTLSTPQVIKRPVYIGLRQRGGTGAAHSRIGVDRRWNSDAFWYSGTGSNTATDWGQLGEDAMLRPVVTYATVNTNDVATITIDNPLTTVPMRFAQTPKATVKNVGTATASSFAVTCSLYQGVTGVYGNAQTVTLAPNTSTQVTFTPYTFNAYGIHTMKVFTNLSGDGYRGNDTISLSIMSDSISDLNNQEGGAAYYYGIRNYFATKFTPQAACTVLAMKYCIYRTSTTVSNPCSAFIWNNTSNNPGTILWGPTPFSGVYYATWDTVDIPAASRPYIPLGGSFFGGLFSVGPTGSYVISILSDAAKSSTGRNRTSADRTTWSTSGRNFFIHAIVKYLNPPSNDIGVRSIDNPTVVVKPNYTYVPKATIQNSGNSTVTGPSPNFSVRCMIDTAGAPSFLYDVTVQPNTIRPGETAQLSFGSGWTPTVLGKYYRIKIKKSSVPADNNLANDSLVDSVYCSDIDIISYNTGGYFFYGAQGDTSYCVQRFTPELPCSLVGYWIQVYDSVPNWNKECTTFVWDNRGDGKEWPRAQQLTPWSEAWTPNPGTGRGYWIRRTISPSLFYNMNQDFWIGFKDPNGTAAARFPVMLLDHRLDYGRSFWDANRDSTWWYPLNGDWALEAIVKYLGGEPKIIRGNVITGISASDTTLHARGYLAKNPEQVITDISSTGVSVSQIETNKALWQVDCRYFWPPWAWNNRMFAVIDYEQYPGTSGHIGYYATIIDTLLRTANPQDAPACTLRAIPKPAYNVTQWTGSRKILRIHWNPAKKDIGKPDTTYVVGYNVYRSLDDAVNLPFRKTMSAGINDTIFTDTLYPPWGTHYYAIKILYAGHTFGENPATIESHYLSENLPVSTIGIEEEKLALPLVFGLDAPRPNPFMQRAVIKYAVPWTSQVSIKLYDATGRLIVTLIDAEVQPGYYEVRLDRKKMASGVYFCKMNAGEFSAVTKLILVR